MDFQLCTIQDVTMLRQLSISTYRSTFDPYNTEENMNAYLSAAFSKEKLESELLEPASRFYFGIIGTEIIGYIKVNEAPAQTEYNTPDSLELERIYIEKDYWGAGYGTQLLEKAISCARQGRKRTIWLGVWEHNHRAQRFYKKHGFKRFSQHIFRMGSDEQLDYLMQKDLSLC